MNSPSPRILGREARPERVLPYGGHLTPFAIRLDTGALMTMVRLEGVSFETADIGELNALHEQLNGLWRSLADERIAVWHHLVRRAVAPPQAGQFISDFARTLDERMRARWAGRRMLVNELYLTLLLRPGAASPASLCGHLSKRRSCGTDGADLKRLDEAAGDLMAGLARYAPRRLGLSLGIMSPDLSTKDLSYCQRTAAGTANMAP